MDPRGVQAAVQHVEMVAKKKSFAQQCKVMEGEFAEELTGAKSTLASFLAAKKVVRLNNGKHARVVTKQVMRVVTSARINEAFGAVTRATVASYCGVASAVSHALQDACAHLTDTVVVTDNTDNLPPEAFPIQVAPVAIERMCAQMQEAQAGLTAVRRHKRAGTKITDGKIRQLESEVQHAYEDATGTTVPPPKRPRATDDAKGKAKTSSKQGATAYDAETTPGPGAAAEATSAASCDDDATTAATTTSVIIAPPPAVTLPGATESTPLPPLPVDDAAAAATTDRTTKKKRIITTHSDTVKAPIRIDVRQTNPKGKSPTLKQYASKLARVLRGVSTYEDFDKRRDELTAKAIEVYEAMRNAKAQTYTKLKVVLATANKKGAAAADANDSLVFD
jgi:hypothetical protein